MSFMWAIVEIRKNVLYSIEHSMTIIVDIESTTTLVKINSDTNTIIPYNKSIISDCFIKLDFTRICT